MIKEPDGKGNTAYKYPKCPVCGSKRTHHAIASEKAIKMEVVDARFKAPFMLDQRGLEDPAKRLPSGTDVPTILSVVEICEGCGVLRAVEMYQGTAKKVLVDQQGRDISKPRIFKPGEN